MPVTVLGIGSKAPRGMERLQKEPEVGPEKQGEKSKIEISFPFHSRNLQLFKAFLFLVTTGNDLFLSPSLLPAGVIFAKASQGISSLRCLHHKKLARG